MQKRSSSKRKQINPIKVWRTWETENVNPPLVKRNKIARENVSPKPKETLPKATGRDEEFDASGFLLNEQESCQSNNLQGQKSLHKGLAFSLQFTSSQTLVSNPQCATSSENNEAKELLRSGNSKKSSEILQNPETSYADMSYSENFRKDMNEQSHQSHEHSYDFREKSFQQKSDVKKHQKNLKTENSFRCSVCQKCFTRKYGLERHERIHTGEKPYACEVCNKMFNVAFNLKQHITIHSDERPYQCDVCADTFKRSEYLKSHKQIHTEGRSHTCKVCGQIFQLLENLRIHKRIHVEEIPYFCEFCGNNFKCPADLEVHKRIHTGERPYVCDICKNSFAHVSNFVKHKNTHK